MSTEEKQRTPEEILQELENKFVMCKAQSLVALKELSKAQEKVISVQQQENETLAVLSGAKNQYLLSLLKNRSSQLQAKEEELKESKLIVDTLKNSALPKPVAAREDNTRPSTPKKRPQKPAPKLPAIKEIVQAATDQDGVNEKTPLLQTN